MDGAYVAGATNTALILPKLQFSDAGAYTVVVSNAAGQCLNAHDQFWGEKTGGDQGGHSGAHRWPLSWP
jgi:hypothetical protein